jgi:hypothetical protein
MLPCLPGMRVKLACFAVAIGLAAASGCNRSKPEPSSVRATVTCASAPLEPVLDCEVEHLSGSRGAKVCWVVDCDCPGGKRVSSSRLCQTVLPGSTVRRSLAMSELGSCERALKSKVTSLSVAPL